MSEANSCDNCEEEHYSDHYLCEACELVENGLKDYLRYPRGRKLIIYLLEELWEEKQEMDTSA